MVCALWWSFGVIFVMVVRLDCVYGMWFMVVIHGSHTGLCLRYVVYGGIYGRHTGLCLWYVFYGRHLGLYVLW